MKPEEKLEKLTSEDYNELLKTKAGPYLLGLIEPLRDRITELKKENERLTEFMVTVTQSVLSLRRK